MSFLFSVSLHLYSFLLQWTHLGCFYFMAVVKNVNMLANSLKTLLDTFLGHVVTLGLVFAPAS